jgi:ADP-ribosyl-[dinitrogen reductase] hydrolase
MSEIKFDKRVEGALLGGVVGDALGVPVEFKNRIYLDKNPVTDMIGYGSHNQPPGTWSDDTSMGMCIVSALIDNGYDRKKIVENWCRWAFEAEWTPHGVVFDIGNSTISSLSKYRKGVKWEDCKNKDRHSNGNGSLMRTMPISLWVLNQVNVDKACQMAREVSALTHAHAVSKWCCEFHALMVRGIMNGLDIRESVKYCNQELAVFEPAFGYLDQTDIDELRNIMTGNVLDFTRDQIKSSGWVVHCLEASLWCLANNSDFSSTVLSAVNLGDDTDTTGCVAGGLAGLYYGVDDIPQKWIDVVCPNVRENKFPLLEMIHYFTKSL